MGKGERKSGWIDMDGRDENGAHQCSTPLILAHSGLFAPKVGALWGCKCGQDWKIVQGDGRLEWARRTTLVDGRFLEMLAMELISKLPADKPDTAAVIVPAVLQELAAQGLIRLSDVPREA